MRCGSLSLMEIKGFCHSCYSTAFYHVSPLSTTGPACSDSVEPLAGVSKLYRTVVISYSAEGSSFSDRSKYPYFYRTIGENNQYK